jgi:hypothetical protein
MREQTAQGSGLPLALQRVEARNTLSVRSDAFSPGGAIPRIHSEYYDGVAGCVRALADHLGSADAPLMASGRGAGPVLALRA